MGTGETLVTDPEVALRQRPHRSASTEPFRSVGQSTNGAINLGKGVEIVPTEFSLAGFNFVYN